MYSCCCLIAACQACLNVRPPVDLPLLLCFRLENDARTSAHPPLAWSITDSFPSFSPFVKCRKRKLKFVPLHLLSSP